MIELEKHFPTLYDGLTPEQVDSMKRSASKAVLLQASHIGPEEYLSVAREVGASAVDVVVALPGWQRALDG